MMNFTSKISIVDAWCNVVSRRGFPHNVLIPRGCRNYWDRNVAIGRGAHSFMLFSKDKFSSIYMPYFHRSLKCYPTVPLEFTFSFHYPLDACQRLFNERKRS